MQKKSFHLISYIIIGFFLLYNNIPAHASSRKKFIVVLDAGHGGHDPGAVCGKHREKDINLKVTLKLGDLIEKKCPDTKVIYTRNRDVFIPLHTRADIANNAKADLFISIHTNSVASRTDKVYGTETYTLGLHRTKDNLEVAKKENSVILIEENYKQRYAGFNPNSSESYIIFEFLQDKNMVQSVNLAQLIQSRFRQSKRKDKGVHQAGFLVLRATSMPGVLVELGYVTNPSEASFLNSERGSQTMANSIFNAFVDYKNSTKTQDNISSAKTAVQQRESVKDSKQQDNIIFKIQILVSRKELSKKSREFKGLTPVSYYKESGLLKYTYGKSSDYYYISKLKRDKVNSKFKDAFIIAFKNGEKININTAIREFKNQKKKIKQI